MERVRRDDAGSDPFRELFEHSADALLIIEGDTFVDCNDAAVAMLRASSREAVLRLHPSVISPPKQPDGRDSYEKANEMIALAFEKGNHRFEWDHMRSDGDVFPVEVLLTAIQEPGRRVLHAQWRDISERKALEEQLRHSQKMEAIGKLAGGIAHDFNNLLVVVLGHADLLGRRVGDDAKATEYVARIKKAGTRAAALVEQLLAFGRKQQMLRKVLDLREVVASTATLVRPMLGGAVELEVDTSCPPVSVLADRGQLEQVLLNLAANARDAMPRGGKLRLATAVLEKQERYVTTTATLDPGRYAVLEVGDTGTGMTPEVQARAFDPFFTTKEVGEGTGLGLATVYGIVTQYGGAVDLSTTPGVGTEVRIVLPMSDEVADDPPSERLEPDDLRGTETILVAEDEPDVSLLVVETLRSRGYTVFAAGDGKQALERYLEHADEIDLLLTDVIMPRMTGVELVKELASTGHRPPVLFMSGYTNNALNQLAELEADIDLLRKPFDTRELSRRLRGALDNARSG